MSENMIGKEFIFNGDYQTPAGRFKVIKQCDVTKHCDAKMIEADTLNDTWGIDLTFEGFYPSIVKNGAV